MNGQHEKTREPTQQVADVQLSLYEIGDEGLHVRQIGYHDAVPFLLEVHYARRVPSIVFAFGLFHGSEMLGVVTYGSPASPSLCVGIAGPEHRREVLELNRLVILPEAGRNAASTLIGRSLRMIPGNWYVVSYADIGGWGHVGYVYQATNWMYTGMTKRRTDIYSEGHSRHYDKSETARQIRSEKHRYIYIVAETKRTRKTMMEDLRYHIEDYPKGETRRYDTQNPVGLLRKLV